MGRNSAAKTTRARTLEGVNAMPAPTWDWLKINDAHVEVPELVVADVDAVSVETDEPEVLMYDEHAFDRVLEHASRRYEDRRRASAPGDAANKAQLEAGEVGPLDVPALSRYQEGAVRTEEELSVEEAFHGGLGRQAGKYLRKLAGEPIVIYVEKGASAAVTVRVDGVDGAAAAANIDVVVERDASLDLVIALDSPQGGAGLAGWSLSVAALENARVRITCVQTLDDGYLSLDDTGFFTDEGARVDVRHVVLGASASYTGLAGDLRGDLSKATVTTSYLGAREQVRDFNYELAHRGRRTECDMQANGVLAGTSKKTLRGTIDLVHGCKGSQGNERETVLLVDERVENKTVPVILCDEDDVMGNHGATIGHVRPEQLLYLGCRGLSQDEAEALFLRAKLEDAALSAPDERIRAGVVRLGSELVDDFEEGIS